jgi:hypothetical protein
VTLGPAQTDWPSPFLNSDSPVKQLNAQPPAVSRRNLRPKLCLRAALDQQRAQGMPGAGRNPWPPCNKKARGRNHRFSQIIRHSLRDGLLLTRDLPGDRAFLPPSPARSSSRKLGLSVGRPGPHDFVVRAGGVRPHDKRARRQSVHRIPPSTSVTIAKRPSCESGTGGMETYISDKQKRFIFPGRA